MKRLSSTNLKGWLMGLGAIALVLVIGMIAVYRIGGTETAGVKYRPPPVVADDGALTEGTAFIERVASAAEPEVAKLFPSSERATSAAFVQTFSSFLRAYNSGDADAFLEARRFQGFGVPPNWDDETSPRGMLTAQAGVLSGRAADPQVTVTRRITGGRLVELEPGGREMGRVQGTVGTPRGEGDIIDPVAEQADAIEVAFPSKVRGTDGTVADGKLRVWLVKRPQDQRWLVWRVAVDYPADVLQRGVPLPPI